MNKTEISVATKLSKHEH